MKHPRSDADSKRADWTRHKFDWLRTLLKDAPTRGLAHDIGTLLAIQYLNATSEEAWPSIDTLADDLNISRSGCIQALNKLVDGGWLQRQRGGGSRRSTRYRLPDRIPAPRRSNSALQRTVASENSPLAHTKQSTPAHETVHPGGQKQSTSVDPIRERKENEYGGRESPRLRRDSPSIPQVSYKAQGDRTQQPYRRKAASRPPVCLIPIDWMLSNEEIATAHQLAGWDLPKTEDEFAKFKSYYASKGSHSANWPAAWANWCRRGREYEAKQETKPLTGLQSGLLGFNTWLQAQKLRET